MKSNEKPYDVVFILIILLLNYNLNVINALKIQASKTFLQATVKSTYTVFSCDAPHLSQIREWQIHSSHANKGAVQTTPNNLQLRL